jgi:hypothetical protein
VCPLIIPRSIAGFRSTRRRSKGGCAGSSVADARRAGGSMRVM